MRSKTPIGLEGLFNKDHFRQMRRSRSERGEVDWFSLDWWPSIYILNQITNGLHIFYVLTKEKDSLEDMLWVRVGFLRMSTVSP